MHSVKDMVFLEFKPILHGKVLQHIAGVSTFAAKLNHCTDIIARTIDIFFCEMRPHLGLFLPSCHGSSLQVFSSVDT